ncbi:MAG: gyrase inhibitor YacG [Caulobacter sp.]|nr:gyrase inhibitor YacG [Caulobacter sp.]
MSSPCPICGKPVVLTFRPFCSKRCADVDLQRWLSDRYVVPGTDEDEENPPSTDVARE